MKLAEDKNLTFLQDVIYPMGIFWANVLKFQKKNVVVLSPFSAIFINDCARNLENEILYVSC